MTTTLPPPPSPDIDIDTRIRRVRACVRVSGRDARDCDDADDDDDGETTCVTSTRHTPRQCGLLLMVLRCTFVIAINPHTHTSTRSALGVNAFMIAHLTFRGASKHARAVILRAPRPKTRRGPSTPPPYVVGHAVYDYTGGPRG